MRLDVGYMSVYASSRRSCYLGKKSPASEVFPVTTHDFLNFLSELTKFLGRAPTREELSVNYWENAGQGKPLQATVRGEMQSCFRWSKAQGWVLDHAKCGPDCHARHVALTAQGYAMLERWNRAGCGRSCAVGHGGVKLDFKEAS